MTRSIARASAVCLIVLGGVIQSATGPGPVPDHVEILAPEPAKTVAWYVAHMGGRSTKPDRVAYGGMQLIVHKENDELGSKIDHVAIGVADVDAKVKELTAAGA